HEQEPPPLARRSLVGGRRPRARRLHLGKRIDATPRNGRRFSLLGGGQPGEQPLHGADPGQVAAGVVVAAALSRRQPEAAPRVAVPRTAASVSWYIPTALDAGWYTSNGFHVSRHRQYVLATGLPEPST